MEPRDRSPHRRDVLTATLAAAAFAQSASPSRAIEPASEIVIERPAKGTPHKGKVLLAVQAHSDDIPLMASGIVAKLVREGYTGHLLRAANDDMGDAPGLGTPGTVGEHVLRNEQDNAAVARALGLKKVFDFNYNNHRMGDVSLNELIGRLIFLIRHLKVDTVVSWDPWGHYEENPDHEKIARAVEAACWMAGRKHDFPEHLDAGLMPYDVKERYYYARHPGANRIVDVSEVLEQMIECNRANLAKGPAGNNGSRLKAELAKKGLKLPLLGDNDETADRNYIKMFILSGRQILGKKHGLEYAEAVHYLQSGSPSAAVDDYVKKNAVPLQ